MKNSRASSAHTTGPWMVYVTPGDTLYISSPKHNIAAICNNAKPEELAANARLIAAAPDLLRLARSFHCACTERMSILRDERAEAFADTEDIDDQLGHWGVLLNQCAETITKVG
jgi:hypothetical protein